MAEPHQLVDGVLATERVAHDALGLAARQASRLLEVAQQQVGVAVADGPAEDPVDAGAGVLGEREAALELLGRDGLGAFGHGVDERQAEGDDRQALGQVACRARRGARQEVGVSRAAPRSRPWSSTR
jgi:hypothetical protein